ncbi:uncharacterized protein LOC131669363 [Phymastichus coffea]|uniref:uncharacterized protein LOC131669363 n=1 Tax=Phymastichus coffea TaxID=108790 RepID=UPI00273B5586|nr:uncharacterized protein LOC131669363 [Phymastichus coffea]
MLAAQNTPVNRRSFDPRQVSIQMARAPQRNLRRPDDHQSSYSFVVQTPHGPTMRLRVNLIAVDRQTRQPRVRVLPTEDVREQPAAGGESARTRGARSSKKSTCNHALDRKFCSKCHIRRRHLNRWWLRQQYRQH